MCMTIDDIALYTIIQPAFQNRHFPLTKRGVPTLIIIFMMLMRTPKLTLTVRCHVKLFVFIVDIMAACMLMTLRT